MICAEQKSETWKEKKHAEWGHKSNKHPANGESVWEWGSRVKVDALVVAAGDQFVPVDGDVGWGLGHCHEEWGFFQKAEDVVDCVFGAFRLHVDHSRVHRSTGVQFPMELQNKINVFNFRFQNNMGFYKALFTILHTK